MMKIKLQLIGLWLLNLIDALSTVAAIRDGWAMESNPITDLLISYDPVIFVIFKVAFITICLLFLWANKDNRIVKRIVPWVVIAYSLLVIWHAMLWGFVGATGKAQVIQTIEEDAQCQIQD